MAECIAIELNGETMCRHCLDPWPCKLVLLQRENNALKTTVLRVRHLALQFGNDSSVPEVVTSKLNMAIGLFS